MNLSIPFLQQGDKLAIVAPAKAIEESHVLFAKAFFEDKGYEVVVGRHCLGRHHYFSGNEAERTYDFQQALNDPSVKAIICARGGYGCVQIVDKIQWAAMLRSPKWIVGFSDVTVFHQRAQRYGLQSIHATMPLNFSENTEDALQTLCDALTQPSYRITAENSPYNHYGKAEGKLVGGNLSVLYSLLGTDDQIDFTETILFIEDLAEHLYAIDRMFYALSKVGALDKIKGLVVGGMTNMKDTAVPFGLSLEELILSHFEYRNIPIAFGFPAGHINDNRALRLGESVNLKVEKTGVEMIVGS